MITGAHARSGYFEPDLRNITEGGVAQVMGTFGRHFLDEASHARAPAAASKPNQLSAQDRKRFTELSEIVCDEEAIDP